MQNHLAIIGIGSVLLKTKPTPRLINVLVLGLILFFNQDIQELVDSIEQYFIGVIFLLLSASCWVVFIVLQKHLLMQVSASTLMLLLYGGTASLLTNFALPEKVFSLNPTQIAALIFCCLSTVISYASFAKSMEYWETSRSAAMLALVPITTAILVALAVAISPELIPPDPITPLGIIGIVLVLVGASATSLGSSSP
ncbi:MAG: EamA family transporter [Cyanobacteria bacterium RU_5_0]|nr:EamA family transporter [Cyanobacteria bacterium RU_5_0]